MLLIAWCGDAVMVGRLKMQDQSKCHSRVDNAGPENAGPENQDRKIEDERPERMFCNGNMRDCLNLFYSCKTQLYNNQSINQRRQF